MDKNKFENFVKEKIKELNLNSLDNREEFDLNYLESIVNIGQHEKCKFVKRDKEKEFIQYKDYFISLKPKSLKELQLDFLLIYGADDKLFKQYNYYCNMKNLNKDKAENNINLIFKNIKTQNKIITIKEKEIDIDARIREMAKIQCFPIQKMNYSTITQIKKEPDFFNDYILTIKSFYDLHKDNFYNSIVF